MAPPLGTLVQAEDWALNGFPIPQSTLGQLSAVAVDPHGDLHVLHRGPVVWDVRSVWAGHQLRGDPLNLDPLPTHTHTHHHGS